MMTSVQKVGPLFAHTTTDINVACAQVRPESRGHPRRWREGVMQYNLLVQTQGLLHIMLVKALLVVTLSRSLRHVWLRCSSSNPSFDLIQASVPGQKNQTPALNLHRAVAHSLLRSLCLCPRRVRQKRELLWASRRLGSSKSSSRFFAVADSSERCLENFFITESLHKIYIFVVFSSPCENSFCEAVSRSSPQQRLLEVDSWQLHSSKTAHAFSLSARRHSAHNPPPPNMNSQPLDTRGANRPSGVAYQPHDIDTHDADVNATNNSSGISALWTRIKAKAPRMGAKSQVTKPSFSLHVCSPLPHEF